MAWLLLVPAIAWLAFVLAAYGLQRQLIYPGAAMGGALAEPAPWGELVSISTPDEETLAAFYQAGSPDGAAVIFFHGNADRIDRYGFLASALAGDGTGLLAISYRGFAGSSGQPSEAGVLADGLAAYDWLRARHTGPIVLVGQSLGSGVAVHVATRRAVARLILVSAYDSILAVARAAYFFLPVTPLLKTPIARTNGSRTSMRRPSSFMATATASSPFATRAGSMNWLTSPKSSWFCPGTATTTSGTSRCCH